MNTCAECRFWRDEVRNLLGPIYPIERPDWKECTRPNDDDNGIAVHTFTGIRADYVALITRSDFGCVQFEPLPMKIEAITISDRDKEFLESQKFR